MGNPNPKRVNMDERWNALTQNYYKKNTVDDPRYGEVTVYASRFNPTDKLLVKEKWTNSKPETYSLAELVTNRSYLVHKNLAKVKAYNNEEDDQWCSSFYKHKMAFEYYDRNLEQELYEKSLLPGNNCCEKLFSEEEVWYIFDSLVQLETLLVENGNVHSDIQPKTCLIDPHGFVKVIDFSLVNYGKSGYLKMVYEQGYTTTLSPELLKAYVAKEVSPAHDLVKSEVWSIGLTTLCAALNTRIEDFYDWRNGKVDFGELKKCYELMKEYCYSEQLICVLQGCLDEFEDTRTGLRELYEFLLPHQEEIRRGCFSCGYPPQPQIIVSTPRESYPVVERIVEQPVVYHQSPSPVRVTHVEKVTAPMNKKIEERDIVKVEPVRHYNHEHTVQHHHPVQHHHQETTVVKRIIKKADGTEVVEETRNGEPVRQESQNVVRVSRQAEPQVVRRAVQHHDEPYHHGHHETKVVRSSNVHHQPHVVSTQAPVVRRVVQGEHSHCEPQVVRTQVSNTQTYKAGGDHQRVVVKR